MNARRSFAGALVLATNPAFIFWSFSGLETPLTCLLALLALVHTLDESPSRTTWLIAASSWAAAVMTRPETVLLAGTAAAVLGVRTWPCVRSIARNLAVFAPAGVVVAAHLLWRHAYYGSWTPNTFAAKAGIGPGVLAAGGAKYVLAGVVAFLPVVAVAFVARSRDSRWIWWCCAAWCLSLVPVGGDFFPYFRFIVPLLPLIAWKVGTLPPQVRHSAVVLPSAIVLANATLLVGPEATASRWERRQAAAWGESGQLLREQLSPQASVASMVIGAVGYFSQRPMIDLLGLTDAHIARAGRTYPDAMVGHQRFETDYVLSRRPEVIFLPSSGLFDTPQHASRGWPAFSAAQLRQAYGLADLVNDPRTRTTYRYQVDRLPNGTFLETLRRESDIHLP